MYLNLYCVPILTGGWHYFFTKVPWYIKTRKLAVI